MEEPDEEYPIVLTTGRVVSQYLSGSVRQEELESLVDIYPEPLLEIHPKLAAQYGIQENDLIKVSTRRGSALFPANVVETIRKILFSSPITGGVNSVNQLTIDAFRSCFKDTGI